MNRAEHGPSEREKRGYPGSGVSELSTEGMGIERKRSSAQGFADLYRAAEEGK